MTADAGAAGRRMAFNALARAVTEVLVKVASLVLFAALARTLGETPLGQFAFALAITQLVWAFAGLGLDRMTVRDIARDHDAVHRLFYDALAIKITAAVATFGVVIAVLAVVGWDERVILLVAILGFDLCLGFASASAQAVFQAHERLGAFFVVAVPAGFLNAALGLTALALGGGIVAVALASVAAHVVGTAFAIVLMYRRFGGPAVRVRPRTWPGLIRAAVPFGVQEMLGQLIFRFDTLLLGIIASAAVLGQYSAAYRMLEATLFLAWSVGSSVLPQYSYLPRRADAGGGASLESAFEGSLKLVLLAMAPIATTLLVCAASIVDAVYGDEFAESVPVLRILAVAIVVFGVGHLAGLLVLVRRPGRVTIAYNAAIAVLNVALCAVLIPLYEGRGAAVATLAAEALLAGAGLVLAARAVGWPRLRGFALSPLLGAAAMAAGMAPLADQLWLALPLGAVLYAAVVLALERRALKEQIAALRRPAPGQSATP